MAEWFLSAPLIGLPVVTDRERAALAIAELEQRCGKHDDPELGGWARELADDPGRRQLLESIFSNSPFLTQCALGDVRFLRQVLGEGPDTALADISSRLKDELAREMDRDRLMRELRLARRRVALLVALADITGHWPLERVTQALSDFADAALSAAISHLLLEAAGKGDLVLSDPHFPEDGAGYVALAMGKHGARELNYSSDIDLIILYEPMKVDYRGSRSVQETFIRMTRRLVQIMQDRTADGYVARVDLRLRPDPGSSQVAIPCAAAQAYYTARGENWERAAMIKARPAAGDLALGRHFLDELTAFVWREQMDFWMIRDIQAIKQRINAERGGGEIEFLGHNVKLGRGGIREIEFFAQTQQLIFGGRDPYLRCLRTVEALTTLAEAGCIDDRVADELTEAYEFLRQLEHRLQMVADQQTQTLPGDAAEMTRLAGFMGFDDVDDFRGTLFHHLHRVEAHYSEFFEDAADPATPLALDLNGDMPNDQSIALLGEIGFAAPAPAFDQLQRWHDGGLPATRDPRGLKLLQALIPRILESVAKRTDPDGVLDRFGEFLVGLRAGVRCLSLLSANPAQLELLVEIVATAPALTDLVCRQPDRLEGALSAGAHNPLPERRLLFADSAEALGKATDLQSAVEIAAIWANDHRFQIAVGVLRHAIDATDAGHVLSDIADAMVHHLHDRLARELARELAGDDGPPGGDMVILGYGPYGARELAVCSPLEILFVHDEDQAAASFYPRLARRLTTVLSARTASGPICEIELGPSPWGARGPIVTSFDAFEVHLGDDASGEQLRALAQARVVSGPTELAERIVDAIRNRLTQGSDRSIFRADHADATGFWDLRRRRGGLGDLDGLVRELQRRHAPANPDLMAVPIPVALAGLGALGLIDEPRLKRLIDAYHLFRQLDNMLAVVVGTGFERLSTSAGAKSVLVRAADAPDFAALSQAVEDAARTVLAAFGEFADAAGGGAP